MAAMRASQPQLRPMTSMTNARECDDAVDEMLSTASQMRWSALVAPVAHDQPGSLTVAVKAAPMVMSVPAMSLSILPTSPTMLRCAFWRYCSSVMSPASPNQLPFRSKGRE